MARRVTTYVPPPMSIEHDTPLLNLAHAIARAYKYKTSGEIHQSAKIWLSDWEDFQGRDYLNQDLDLDGWYEKRIQILLQLLVDAHNRNAILLALADELLSYSNVVATCPSGYFSKNIDEQVADILDKNIK